MAIGAPADLAGAFLPIAIGIAAQRLGLGSAMWFLLGAQLAVLSLLPSGSVDERDQTACQASTTG